MIVCVSSCPIHSSEALECTDWMKSLFVFAKEKLELIVVKPANRSRLCDKLGGHRPIRRQRRSDPNRTAFSQVADFLVGEQSRATPREKLPATQFNRPIRTWVGPRADRGPGQL